jgi:hypothetical protein
VERHRKLPALAHEPAQPGEEVHVPGLAAHLAVGDAQEADVFLLAHRLPDRRILGGGQLGRARPARVPLETQRLERGRPQQAAHVIGAERHAEHRHS